VMPRQPIRLLALVLALSGAPLVVSAPARAQDAPAPTTTADAQGAPEAALSGQEPSESELLEGLAKYEAMVRERPKDPEARQLLATAYAQLERWDDARAACNAAIQLAPESAELYQCLGLVEEGAKNYD